MSKKIFIINIYNGGAGGQGPGAKALEKNCVPISITGIREAKRIISVGDTAIVHLDVKMRPKRN